MRILHVITALGVGGTEQSLVKLLGAEALADLDHHVFSLLPGGALAGPLRHTGAAVLEFDLLGGLKLLYGTAALVRRARELDADLIQGWLYHGNLWATVAHAAVRRRVPLVWNIRQSLPGLQGENAHARFAIRMGRLLSARPQRILYNSTVSAEQHRRFGFRADRTQFIPNGFDVDRFRPRPDARRRLRSEWGVADDAPVFGVVARYHPVKDHAGFLAAAREVLDGAPAARFVMAGTGVDDRQASLTAQIEALGLTSAVKLLGERHDIPDVMAALDVAVSSSIAEAFSNAVGEAMSCGLPCVVTSVGESAFLVGDTGSVVPPSDPGAMARAMLSLANVGSAARNAMGCAARRRVETHFSLASVARSYRAVYRELAHGAA